MLHKNSLIEPTLKFDCFELYPGDGLLLLKYWKVKPGGICFESYGKFGWGWMQE